MRDAANDRAFFDDFAELLRAPTLSAPPFRVAGDETETQAAIAVYRNNIRSSLSRALGEQFPIVAQLVGDAFFKFAAGEYFNAHPPTSRLIADYGDAFPTFLENFPPARVTPYLGDVARLEAAWLETYRAADAKALTAEEILAAGGGDPSALRFAFHPSLRLLRSDFPVASIWRRCKEEDKSIDTSSGGPECVMIARPHGEVHVHVLPPGAFEAIAAMTAGADIARAFETAASADQDFDPQAAFQIIFKGGVVIAADRESGSKTS